MISTFESLSLPPLVDRAVARLGFTTPTPVQAQAIPIALKGGDLIGLAQTGTGKTAAYCIPMLARFLSEPNSLGLVLVPTRELAKQVEDFWNELTLRDRNMTCTCLIGGMSMQPQTRALSRSPRLVIATPGRLIDHLDRRTINLARVSVLVLDEADRMLDMGFEPQLTRIAKFVPPVRQTLLFSATMQPEAERLSVRFVKNPARVQVGEISRTADLIDQSVVLTDIPKKNEALLDEINRWQKESILVFTRTKSRTDRVAKFLASYDLPVARIHGGRSQGQRNLAMRDFREGKARILVATDIAARGLDVAHVRFVINYDLPQVPEDYVHRIGRTGRAGASGEAVSLVVNEERGLWRDIIALLKKTGSPLPVSKDGKPIEFPGGGGGGGGGKSGRPGGGHRNQKPRFGRRDEHRRGKSKKPHHRGWKKSEGSPRSAHQG